MKNQPEMLGSLQAEDNRRQDGCDGIRWRPAWQWPDEAKDKIEAEMETCPGPVLHLCCGASRLGDIRVDLTHPSPDIRADARQLPLGDHSVGTVVMDPPFGIKNVYERQKFITEVGRVLEGEGVFLLYAPWFPGPAWAELEDVWVRVSSRHRLPHAAVLLTRWRRTEYGKRQSEIERREKDA